MRDRQCIFCNNQAKTKEHLWPAWTLDNRPKKVPFKQTRGKGPATYFCGEVEAKCVCEQCNTGWMSALEERIKPILGPLMADFSIPIDVTQQRCISVWSVKMAMVWEAMKPASQPRFYRQEDCKNLRLNSVIPAHTGIWLGRFSGCGHACVGSDTAVHIHVRKDERISPSRDGSGYCLSLIVGHLAIQVLAIGVPANIGIQSNNIEITCRGQWDALLVSIHPSHRTITWPPKHSLTNGNGVHSFARMHGRWRTEAAQK